MAYTKWDYARFDDVLDRIKGKTVLDVGFGNGEMLQRLSDFEVTGVDINIGNIQEVPYNVQIYKMDIRSLDFEDNSFDTVIAMEIIEHNPEEDNERMISELRRVAIRVIVTVPFDEPEPLYKGHTQSFNQEKIDRLFPNAETWIMPRGKGTPWIGVME